MALVIAVAVYVMPIDLALNSTLLGICFGPFPIVWIVVNATFPKYKHESCALALGCRPKESPPSASAEHLEDDRAWAICEKAKRVTVAGRATPLDTRFYVTILLASQ